MSDKKKTTILVITGVFVFVAATMIVTFLILQSVPQKSSPELQPTEERVLVSQTVSFLPEIINITEAETFASLTENMQKLSNEYPDLLEYGSAGKSVGGRELLMLKLGTGAEKALIIGGIHAREHISTKYLLCCIETYCRAFNTDEGLLGGYDIRSLLTKYTLYIVPCVNPDGLEIIHSRDEPAQGVKVKKIGEYKANKNGVDLNRNFPLAWDKINNGINSPSEYYFKGYSAASEPETAALCTLCAQNEFEFAVSVHIKGNCIFWGDMYDTGLNDAYKVYASSIADVCALKLTEPTISPNDYGGGFENWFRHTYSHPGFCVELMSNDETISAVDDSNYSDFYQTVNYGCTVFLFAAAMHG